MKELLAFAVEQNASDIHIAVGIPPKLRINGRLTEVELPAMTPADAAEAIGSTMHDRHKQILKERGEVDFSFASPETGRFCSSRICVPMRNQTAKIRLARSYKWIITSL